MIGGGAKTPLGHQQHRLVGVRIQSSAYGRAVAIVYGTNRLAGNLIWYGDFKAVTVNSSTRAGGKGGGSAMPSQQTTTYYASLAFGLCEGPIAGIGNIFKGKEIHTLSDLGLTLFTGTSPTQTPWGYLTTNHPGQDLGYEGLAYVAGSNLLLDSSGNLPNFNYEIQGLLRYYSVSTGQLADAEPSALLNDLLINLQYGAGLSASQIGSLTAYQQYCVANGLFLSPVLDTQQTAVDILKRWLEITNTGAIWSEGVLKTIPYGDAAITANGMTFTPNLTPLYTLTDDDYLYTEGDDPIDVTRSTPADAFNIIKVEFVNRSNNYATEIAQAQDQNSINSNGPRPSSTYSYHEIASPTIAKQVAQLILQRQLYKRNTFKFKVGWKYCLLEPMDVIGITESTLGLTNYLVRITDVEESEWKEGDGAVLTLTCEDMLLGTGAAPLYGSQSGSGYQTNYNVDPGNVNTPVIFEAPYLLAAPRDGAEIWFVASGGVNWGGCEVWGSTDNSTYQKLGVIMGGGRQGVLSATFANGADPDTTHTCAVDLTVSAGTLQSGTTGEADANNTLCYCDGELMSYSTATLTAPNKYNLTTYIRRGLYGTAIGSHAVNAVFARLDQAVFKLYVPQDRIGTLFYFKLLSFNVYGMRTQPLSAATAYTFTPFGKTPPPTVTGFTVQQKGFALFFAWTQVADAGLKGYDIRYQPQGTPNWNTATPFTESQRGTSSTTAAILPGAYTFLIRARDVIDQLSTTTTSANLTVGNSKGMTRYDTPGSYIFTVPDNVDVLRVQGVGGGGSGAYSSAVLSSPGAATLGSSAAGTLAAVTYFVKCTWTDIVGETLGGTESSLAVAVNRVLTVTRPASPPAGATGWKVYVSTATGAETLQSGGTPIPIGTTTWTEPTSGLIAGAALPGTNNTGFYYGQQGSQSTFAQLNSPSSAGLSSTPGGSLTATTYYVMLSWIDASGETDTVNEISLAVAANNVLVVSQPAFVPPGATGWKVYVSTATGAETLQSGGTPIPIGTTTWTEPTSGLIAGAARPMVNTTGYQAGPGQGGTVGTPTTPAPGGAGGMPIVAPTASPGIKGSGGNVGLAGATVSGGNSTLGGGGDATNHNGQQGAGGAGMSTGTSPASGAGAGSSFDVFFPVMPGQQWRLNVGAGSVNPVGAGGNGGDGLILITW